MSAPSLALPAAPSRHPRVWLFGLLLAALWLLLAPPTPDLAAQVYRSNMFGRVGFTLWDMFER